MSAPELETGRLRLRHWRDADRGPFASLNADPVVMEHFPALLTADESNRTVDRIQAIMMREPYGLWAVEVRDGPPFVGFVGLSAPSWEVAGLTPCVEVGWRLARDAWGRGYATEAARRVIAYGLDELGLDEIVSFTSVHNVRSTRLMTRLGLVRDPSRDFDHPKLPGHRLERHVLYAISAPTRPGGPARAGS
ncbi:MAG: GNAT family N-acetyltransferase [Myxococcota bacterium]